MDTEEEVSKQRICVGCVGDTFLKNYIEDNGVEGRCQYCDSAGSTISMEKLADLVEIAFQHHYARTSDEPDTYEELAIRHFEAEFERKGEPVVDAIAGAIGAENEEVAKDIQAVLSERYDVAPSDYCGEETEFDSESYYAEKIPTDEVFSLEWNRFCHQLQTESRFFSQSAEAVLRSIFSATATHQTYEGRPVIKLAGPGTDMASLFRGRCFQSIGDMEEALKHAENALGPPPTRLASAGRMNANGIGVFYGATSPGIVLAEIRPPVGSYVVTGRFILTRNVRLLDIRALASVRVTGSIFDEDYVREIQQVEFYKRLSHLISKPVMPDDQLFEYLPTQAVADYLASDPKLDLGGIIYKSAQGPSPGANVVLFHKASRLEVTQYPVGTRYRASPWGGDEDSPDTEYLVTIEVPHPKSIEAKQRRFFGTDFDDVDLSWAERDPDSRQATLQLDLASLVVRRILAVTFATDDLPVRVEHREQFPEGEEPF